MGQRVELQDELLFEEDCELTDGELMEDDEEEEELEEDEGGGGEEEEEEGEGEDEEMKEPEESTKMKILRQIAGVASKLKEIIGNLITTAGKVVVTILLGLTGT